MQFHRQLKLLNPSSENARPLRMYQQDRPAINNFIKWHRLYIWVTNEDILEGRVISARVKWNNSSANWSKFSKPWDVVFGQPNYGFFQLLIKHLPSELPKEKVQNPNIYSFEPRHRPVPLNYSHTEIVSVGNTGERPQKKEISAATKKEFRQIISDRAVLLQYPKT